MLSFSKIISAAHLSTCAACSALKMPKGLRKNQLYNRTMNRFVKDKGVSRQLENLGLDRMDAALHPDLITSETDLEALRDESKQFRKQFEADEDPDRTKRVMIQKRIFPFSKKPNLLTSVEKETIRYLHQKDPHEWTIERLAESFPVDKYGVKKILKSSGPKSLEGIQRLDFQAADNWKLLSKGKLEIDKALEDHLKQFPRKHIQLSMEDKEKIYEKIRRLSEPVKPKLLAGKGEFTRIIEDYEIKKKGLDAGARLGAGAEVAQRAGDPALIDLGEMSSLFGENSIPGTPWTDESSPYGGTALLNTNINLRKEPSMDIERFRELYFQQSLSTRPPPRTRTLLPFTDPGSRTDPARAAYDQWLRQQADKARLVSKNIKKVDVDEIVRDEEGSRPVPPRRTEQHGMEVYSGRSEKTGREEMFVFSETSGVSKVLVSSPSPDYIDIPPQIKYKYSFFQYKDSVYDSNGEFLYRVPRLED